VPDDARTARDDRDLRRLANGRTIGSIPFTRGPLAYLLHNRFYIGEVLYRGDVCPGEHEAILDRDLFEAVQTKLASQQRAFVQGRAGSAALLMGKLFDDRGNRMSPSHARKSGRRYRYYVSCALSQGRSDEVGSVPRVAAALIDPLVLKALRQHCPDDAQADDRALLERRLARAVIGPTSIALFLTRQDPNEDDPENLAEDEGSTPRVAGSTVIQIDCGPVPARRRREIIRPRAGSTRSPRGGSPDLPRSRLARAAAPVASP
jgi:site-specific DNA recombinase